jgi:NIMA (never in mitosis gene a)-related kinase
MDGFNILSKIGEGSYSTVLKVQRIEDGNIYALKRVKFYKLSEKEKENALNEIRILASVKNKNVISYKEAFFDEKDSSLGIVMEYADKGDLFQLITERKKTKNYFTEQEVWKIFIQLLNGLKALHDFKILHRDIKSANVFLFKGGICKLGDLNVSKVARKGLGYTQTGTPYYASPEVWEEKPYDSKSDVWSLGCVMYETITLRPPFQAKSMEELYKKVMRGNYPRIPTKYSEDLSDAIKLMIQVEAGARPSCEELLKMPMITKRIEFFNNNKDIDITEEQNESINKKFELLKTIMVPNKLENLAKNLPKPNYDTEGNIRSFQNSNRNVHKQYGSLTLSNTDLLPNIKKDKIIIKNYIENNSKSIITESNKNKIQIINNRNNKSLNVKENNYEYRPRIPKSLPKNDNIIKNKQRINKNLILPNLYGNYKANISLKNLNINNKSSNASYKILNSENNVSKNNLNNIKVIDGKNIYGNNKNIINSIGLKKKKYLINQANNDIGKMMIEKISKPKPFNYNLNNYSKGNLDKDFLKIIHQRKKRMIYLGKI